MITNGKKFVFSLVTVAVFVLCIAGCNGCISKISNRTTTTTADDKQQVAELQAQNAALQAQNAQMQKERAKMQELVNEASAAATKASEAADKAIKALEASKTQQQVRAPVFVQAAPNPAVLQVLSQAGDKNDAVYEIRTGRPAIMHELNSQTQLRVEPIMPKAMYTKSDLADAKEKELQVKDQMKDLNDQITRSENQIATLKGYLKGYPAPHNPPTAERKKEWRGKIREHEENIADLQEQLKQLTLKLKTATAEVTRISQALLRQ